MDFTYKELALLNEMISVALLSGQIEFSEEAKTVYKKVTTMLNEESRIGGEVDVENSIDCRNGGGGCFCGPVDEKNSTR